MSDEERLSAELHEAKQLRDKARAELTEAQGDVSAAKAAVRRTPQWKKLQAAKLRIKSRQKDLERAISQLDAVLDEIDTGRTGLHLFDATKPATAQATAFSS